MATQEEINKGMLNLLMMATELFKESNKNNNNFLTAQNLMRQYFFKYLDIKDCPFRDQCREESYKDYKEPEPIDIRG